jgi:Protein of unknown function (DUF992)
MSNFKSAALLSVSLALVAGSGTAHSAPAGIKVGVLSCDVSGGVDLIRSKHSLSCNYQGTGARTTEHYAGHISSIGVNIGYTKDAKIVWAVFAPSSDFKAKALQGEYGGVTAGASVGVGGNANVLVGGLDKSISLQPVSFEASEGINIAAGVSSIKLTATE